MANSAIVSALNWDEDTHALIRFMEEECTAIVPVRRIERKEVVEYGGSCKVKWSNDKIYHAFLLFSGTNEECAVKQDEIDGSDSEEEMPAKKARKDANEKDSTLPKKKTASSGRRSNKAKKTRKTAKDTEKKSKKAKNSKGKKDDFVIHIGDAPSSSGVSPPESTEDHGDSHSGSETDSSSEDDSYESIINVRVDDRPADRSAKPKHRFHSRHEIMSRIDELKADIKKHNDEQRLLLDKEFKELKAKLDLFLASGLARSLSPLLPSAVTTSINQSTATRASQLPTPAMTANSQIRSTTAVPVSQVGLTTTVPAIPCVVSATTVISHVVTSMITTSVMSSPAIIVTSNTGTPTSVCTSTIPSAEPGPSEVEAEVNISSDELMSHTDIVKFFTKGKTRHHMAALLVAEVIDESTRFKSNVRGKGKEKLDPTIIEWVKTKCFEYHPSEGNKKEEWERCVRAIDGKNRGMKRRKSIPPE